MELDTLMLLLSIGCIVTGSFLWYTGWQSKRNAEARDFESIFRPNDDELHYLPNASEVQWRQRQIDEQNERGW